MKITLKDFLAEQAKLGIKVPQIFEKGPGEDKDLVSDEDYDQDDVDDADDDDDEDAENESLKNFNTIVAKLSTEDKKALINLITNEGFFGNIKNALSGTIEYNAGNNYAGSPEAQAFVTKDKRAQIQIETLSKKGMTPEEAKSAVMFVFDKNSKNPLGFMGKTVTYDTATKTLKVGNSPGLGTKNL